jgi:hypothetical protein
MTESGPDSAVGTGDHDSERSHAQPVKGVGMTGRILHWEIGGNERPPISRLTWASFPMTSTRLILCSASSVILKEDLSRLILDQDRQRHLAGHLGGHSAERRANKEVIPGPKSSSRKCGY